jgi:hypothetical protein
MSQQLYRTPYTRHRRNKKPILIGLVVLLAFTLLFRDRIACHLLDAYLSFALSKNVQSQLKIEQKEKRGGHLFLKGVYFSSDSLEMKTEQIDIYTSVHLYPLCIESYVEIEKASVHVFKSSSEGSTSWLSCILPQRFFKIRLNVHKGLLDLPSASNDPLFFSYVSDLSPGGIGSFKLSQDEGFVKEDLCSLSLSQQQKNLQAHVKVASHDLSLLLPILSSSPFSSQVAFSSLAGELVGKVDLVLSKNYKLKKLQGEIDLGHFYAELNQGKDRIRFSSCQGHFSYPPKQQDVENVSSNKKIPFWKKAEGQLRIDNAELAFPDICGVGIQNLNAEMTLLPRQDPSLVADGKMISENQLIPFSVHSCGVIHEDGSFWLQSDVALTKNSNENADLVISLCKVGADDYIAQADFANFDNQLIRLVMNSCHIDQKVSIESEMIEGSITTWMDHRNLTRIDWNRFLVRNSSIHFLENKDFISFKELVSQGQLCKKDGYWHLEEIDASLKDGSFCSGPHSFKEANLQLRYRDKVLDPSTFSTSWNRGLFVMSACGPLQDIKAKVDISSSWKEILHLMNPALEVKEDMDVTFKLDAGWQPSHLFLGGDLAFQSLDKEVSNVQATVDVPLQGNGMFWNKTFNFTDVKGKFYAENLSHLVFAPFLAYSVKEFNITGALGVDVELVHAKIKGEVFAEDFFIQHPAFALTTGPLQHGKSHVAYDFKNDTFSSDIDLSSAFFAHEKSGLCVSKIAGCLSYHDHRLKAVKLAADCEGIPLSLSMYYDDAGLFIETDRFEGKLENLYHIQAIRHLIGDHLDHIHGHFEVPEGGCNIFFMRGSNNWTPYYKFSGSLSDVSLPFDSSFQLSRGQCDFFVDSSTMLSSIKNFQAKLLFSDDTYDLCLDDFVFDPRKDSPFTVKVLAEKKELAALQGAIKLGHDIDIIFDKVSSHLLSIPIQISLCKIDRNWQLQNLKAEMNLSDKAKNNALHLVKNLKLLPKDSSSIIERYAHDIKGDVAAYFSYAFNEGTNVKIAADKLSYQGKVYSQCELMASYKISSWFVEKLSWNTSMLQCALQRDGSMIRIPYLRYASPDLKIDLEAVLDWNQKILSFPKMSYTLSEAMMRLSNYKFIANGVCYGKCRFSEDLSLDELSAQLKFSAQVQSPLQCDMKSDKECYIIYSKSDGFSIKGIDIKTFSFKSNEMWAHLSLEQLNINPKTSRVNGVKAFLSMTPQGTKALAISELLPKDIILMKKDLDWQCKGDFSYASDGFEAKLSLKPGEYVASGKGYKLIDPIIQISSQSLHLRSRMKLVKEEVFCDLQKDFSKEAPLYLLLRSSLDAEGLKILCVEKDGDYFPSRFEGKLLGLEVNLQKSVHISDGSFFGYVHADFSKMQNLLTSPVKDIVDALKLGPGYTVKGHFFLPETEKEEFFFKGDIKASKCVFLGYDVDSMYMRAEINGSKVYLEDVKIDDVAGQLSVKNCQITKDMTGDHWNFYMPLGHLREFKPSYLRENNKKGSDKPFLLKNLSVYDLRGVIGDKKSFTGNGALHFVNSYKKEYSILDLPFEMIKDLGLDTGILTPISGEADFMIKKGRCLFHELRNSYSEGRRSEFFLSPDIPAYVDFEGNWHVDLKMKQHVLLKWSESLLVSIRGTLDKPKYSLKNVEDAR